MKLNIELPDPETSPFFDPSTNLVVVAFTARYDDNDQPVSNDQAGSELAHELQHASEEGILGGDFQIARVVG
jgi:hypothetical protein